GAPPPARQLHKAIYDPVRDRMIVHAGSNGFSDTWALSLTGVPAWTQLAPSGSAPTISRHTAIYDPIGDRLIVFGGWLDEALPQPVVQTNRTWALTLGASP